MAKEQAQNAVVAVLAPICVEKFQHQADAAAKLIEFKKVSSSWDRRSIIEKGGWATMARNDRPNSPAGIRFAHSLWRARLGGGDPLRSPPEHPSSGGVRRGYPARYPRFIF